MLFTEENKISIMEQVKEFWEQEKGNGELNPTYELHAIRFDQNEPDDEDDEPSIALIVSCGDDLDEEGKTLYTIGWTEVFEEDGQLIFDEGSWESWACNGGGWEGNREELDQLIKEMEVECPNWEYLYNN